MLRGPSSVNSTIIEDSISNQPVELNAKSSVEPKISLNNGGQIDARLTKAPPTKTTSIPSVVKSSVQSLSQASSSQATAFPTNMSRLNLLNAGTAVPFSQAIVKTHQNYVVKAINNNATTPFGQLCKVTCTSSSGANNQLWETYVGSQVVSFCLCAKYVLICSIDGTIRFIDIKSGVLVLPIMKMFTPAIQSVFVSWANKMFVGIEQTIIWIFSPTCRVSIASWAVLWPNVAQYAFGISPNNRYSWRPPAKSYWMPAAIQHKWHRSM